MEKVSCLLLVALLGGCGNKGPLYLPRDVAMTAGRDHGSEALPPLPLVLGVSSDG